MLWGLFNTLGKRILHNKITRGFPPGQSYLPDKCMRPRPYGYSHARDRIFGVKRHVNLYEDGFFL